MMRERMASRGRPAATGRVVRRACCTGAPRTSTWRSNAPCGSATTPRGVPRAGARGRRSGQSRRAATRVADPAAASARRAGRGGPAPRAAARSAWRGATTWWCWCPRPTANVRRAEIGRIAVQQARALVPNWQVTVGLGDVCQAATRDRALARASPPRRRHRAAFRSTRRRRRPSKSWACTACCSTSRTPTELRGFIDQVLGPLLAYDQRHQAHLVLTLSTFLAHNGNLQATARELSLHVNSSPIASSASSHRRAWTSSKPKTACWRRWR